eukprot:CAMPEP_0173135922 /NCGR_PEP_ID=MMETSP1105-20130129/2174_1 /TAXON_ID=2985 /ORGANISM="Ochromonas sp., Strain BG-1" /LENGTH=473 /DNA_ID=CAMNT_0014048001 /DNA_START=188 /DNA_END=1607 /DNA_ORIENTATION=+
MSKTKIFRGEGVLNSRLFAPSSEKEKDGTATAKTLKTSGQHRDFIEKVFKKRQYKQMMREETEQVVADNHAKRGDLLYRESYKAVQRQRKAQRGLLKKEDEEGEEEVEGAAPGSSKTDERKGTKSKAVTSSSSQAASPSSSTTSNESETKIYTVMKNPPPSVSAARKVVSEEEVPDRPFTLPPGKFRPKQSLGQNYLSDQNYVNKIVAAFHLERQQIAGQKDDVTGKQVIEIGPGIGAITRTISPLYPDMLAVEIDERAVELLGEKLPSLKVQHGDILNFRFEQYSKEVLGGRKIAIIANLPYHIVSQVLFSLADAHQAIDVATVTAQLEVAERVTASPNTKAYGIPSVILQLYGTTKMNFKIPPTVFYPVPKVDSAADDDRLHPATPSTALCRQAISPESTLSILSEEKEDAANEFERMLEQEGLTLPLKWHERRPESLTPEEFLHLTRELFGDRPPKHNCKDDLQNIWRNG